MERNWNSLVFKLGFVIFLRQFLVFLSNAVEFQSGILAWGFCGGAAVLLLGCCRLAVYRQSPEELTAARPLTLAAFRLFGIWSLSPALNTVYFVIEMLSTRMTSEFLPAFSPEFTPYWGIVALDFLIGITLLVFPRAWNASLEWIGRLLARY